MSVSIAIEQKLTQLKLSRLREVYPHWVKEAEARQLGYAEFLDGLLAEEVVGRQENQIRRQLKAAGFPFAATLEQFDFSLHPELKRAVMVRFFDRTFVEQAQSLILVGTSGLGKPHVAIRLGLAACRQDRRVRFYTVTSLINELQEAQATHQLPHYLAQALRQQLIILDEFGYVPFSPTGAQLLFQFCAALQERVAVLVTTNLPFSAWVQVLGDERLTSGLLDRFTFRCHILEFLGDSFRFRHGLERQASATVAAALAMPPVG